MNADCLGRYALIVLAGAFLLAPHRVACAEEPSIFADPQPTLIRSPAKPVALPLQDGESVQDSDVSPLGPEAALIVRSTVPANRTPNRIVFWDMASGAQRSILPPPDLRPVSLVYHPLGKDIFLLVQDGAAYKILKTATAAWAPTVVYQSTTPLRRIVVGPRPFAVGGSEAPPAYRLFFGVRNADGTFSTRSVAETGKRDYAVLGPAKAGARKGKAAEDDNPEVPATMPAAFALPVGFHPAGHVMLWEDDKRCFHKAVYAGQNWGGKQEVFAAQPVCGGYLGYLPNGTAFLHWERGKAGVALTEDGKASRVVAPDVTFIAPPSSVRDGRGLVGVTQESGMQVVRYAPIDVPLADVANAWMFIETAEDRKLFESHGGLFRKLDNDQLYGLYDSELYSCGGYDSATPTRPYLVTTDIFWEQYGAAFEGIFILAEKHAAIPAFWRFVEAADRHLREANSGSKPARAFAALAALRQGKAESDPEAQRIVRAAGREVSAATGRPFDFADLKPRSHYAASPALQDYFRAMKYLTTVGLTETASGDADAEAIAILKALPPEVMAAANQWIAAYRPFIAPTRNGLVWGDGAGQRPDYIAAPAKADQLFPLSWGVDNEILFSTVNDRIPDRRMLPSGLDVAAVLGSPVAGLILEEIGEFARYPSLKPQIAQLKLRLDPARTRDSAGPSLYARWLDALAVQWSDGVSAPGGTIDRNLWHRKRLQTGLASWATLRHATVLINERVTAECGEAGFEQIVLAPPRGSVEPDPRTFAAIAGLFDDTIRAVEAGLTSLNAVSVDKTKLEGEYDEPSMENLRAGVVRRLAESRDNIRQFGAIAEKELNGTALTAEEYEKIFYVGRAAEHNFLVFKSLASDDFALSNPDPMPKVADVAQAPDGTVLLAGVGRPAEWNQIVPFFGRKEIVKGAVYSYRELASSTVMTDKEWLEKVATLALPAWIAPHFSARSLSCPAKTP